MNLSSFSFGISHDHWNKIIINSTFGFKLILLKYYVILNNDVIIINGSRKLEKN